jgi:tetratricopeptide (TPR) repeat protein
MRNLSLQENLSPSINTAIAWVFYEAGMFKEASVFALKGMRMNCTLLHERKEIAIGIYLLSQLRFANSVHVIAVAQNLIKRKKFSAHFFLYRAILLNITNFVEGAVESMQNYMLGFPEDKKAKRYFDVLNVKKKIILQNIDNPLGALNRPKPYYGFYNDLCTYRLFRGKNQMRGVSVAFDLLRKNISDEPENIIPRIAKYSVDRWNRTDWYQMLVDAGAVIHDFPEHPFGYSYKARCLWYLNRKDEAIRFYEKALAINPYDVDALQYLCLLYEGQKLYTKSVGVNDTLLAIEPFEPGHYGRCALYFLFLKDIKGAKTWLSEFIRVAKFENRENEFSNAIKHLEREIQYAEIRGR